MLYPTLGLFMSFLKDREWAVALCRAYNTFLHEEFVKKSPRLQGGRAAAGAGSRRVRARAAPRGARARPAAAPCCPPTAATCWATRATRPVYEEAQRLDTMLGIHASGSHLGGAGVDLFPPSSRPTPARTRSGRCGRSPRSIFEGIPERFPDAAHRLPRGRLRLGAVLDGADGRRVRQARRRGARAQEEAERLRAARGKIYFSCEADEWLLPQAREARRREPDRLRLRLPALGPRYPASIDEIRERGDLNDAQKRKILADNARRLYGLKG